MSVLYLDLLDGRDSAQASISCLPHFPHASLADFSLEGVTQNRLANFRHVFLPAEEDYMLLGCAW
jgi:hypothetical protein